MTAPGGARNRDFTATSTTSRIDHAIASNWACSRSVDSGVTFSGSPIGTPAALHPPASAETIATHAHSRCINAYWAWLFRSVMTLDQLTTQTCRRRPCLFVAAAAFRPRRRRINTMPRGFGAFLVASSLLFDITPSLSHATPQELPTVRADRERIRTKAAECKADAEELIDDDSGKMAGYLCKLRADHQLARNRL